MMITTTLMAGNVLGGDTEGIDEERSLDAFVWEVETALMKTFPGARLDVRVSQASGAPPETRVWDDAGNELPEVAAEVDAIVEDLWESSTWYVWEWETAIPLPAEDDGVLEGLA